MRKRWIALGLALLVTSPAWMNGLAALAELAAYGTLYRDGRPAALYPDRPGAPELQPGGQASGLLRQASVNSLGLRGPEPREPKPATRIWVLGGSSTYDVHAPSDAGTWPALLEAELRARGRDVEVLNAGRPGEVLMGSWTQLQRHRDALDPDLLLLYHGPNDLRQAVKMQLGGQVELVCDQDVLPPVDIALFRWVERIERAPPPLPSELLERRLVRFEDIERELRQVLRQARDQGMQAVVVGHPLYTRDEDGMERYAAHMGLGPEGIADAYDEYNRRAALIAGQERAKVIDLPALIEVDEGLWGDPSHFSPAGSRAAASILAGELERLDVLR